MPKDMAAFSEYSDRARNGGGDTKLVRFEESKPLPSYLVALAVGPFEIIDGGKGRKNNTPLRVITTRGHRDEVKYALEITPKVFTALENYFGVPYPYEKLDQITIPVTVAFGAMENAGLITYQSSILADASAGRDSRQAAEHDRSDHSRDRPPMVWKHGDTGVVG